MPEPKLEPKQANQEVPVEEKVEKTFSDIKQTKVANQAAGFYEEINPLIAEKASLQTLLEVKPVEHKVIEAAVSQPPAKNVESSPAVKPIEHTIVEPKLAVDTLQVAIGVPTPEVQAASEKPAEIIETAFEPVIEFSEYTNDEVVIVSETGSLTMPIQSPFEIAVAEPENISSELIEEPPKPVALESFEQLQELIGVITQGQESADSPPEHIAESMPPITIEVATKIQTLNEQEQVFVTEAFNEIIALVNDISETRAAGIDAIEVEIKLQELCVQLLEYLGVEYTGQDLNQFVMSFVTINQLLQANNSAIRHNQPNKAIFDNGTHEFKYGTKLKSYGLKGHERLHQLLGMFMLINISPQLN